VELTPSRSNQGVGKLTRSKPSRSSRKQDRERRDRAVKHGLPAALPPQPRKSAVVDPGGHREAEAMSLSVVTNRAASESPRAPSLWEQFRRIPPSLQLLGAGILALIAIGLYRRYTETIPGSEEPSGRVTESVVNEVLRAKPSASLPLPPLSNSLAASANSAANHLTVGSSTPPVEPAVSPTPKTNSGVVAGTKTHSERRVGRSAREPASPARSLTHPSPAANAESDAKPASAENP
jgi:hypothetical protein